MARVVESEAGDRFLLSLDAFYDWTVTVDDPAIVSRLAGVAGPTGSQGSSRRWLPARPPSAPWATRPAAR